MRLFIHKEKDLVVSTFVPPQFGRLDDAAGFLALTV